MLSRFLGENSQIGPPLSPGHHFSISLSSVVSEVVSLARRRVYLALSCDAVMLQSDDVEELTAAPITATTSNAFTMPSEGCALVTEKPRHRCRFHHKDDNSQTDYVLLCTAGPNYKATLLQRLALRPFK